MVQTGVSAREIAHHEKSFFRLESHKIEAEAPDVLSSYPWGVAVVSSSEGCFRAL